MIVDKFFAQQFIGQRHQEESIRRIMRVDGMETAPKQDPKAPEETAYGKISVFDQVPKERTNLQENNSKTADVFPGSFVEEVHPGQTIDKDAIHLFSPGLVLLFQRNH